MQLNVWCRYKLRILRNLGPRWYSVTDSAIKHLSGKGYVRCIGEVDPLSTNHKKLWEITDIGLAFLAGEGECSNADV